MTFRSNHCDAYGDLSAHAKVLDMNMFQVIRTASFIVGIAQAPLTMYFAVRAPCFIQIRAHIISGIQLFGAFGNADACGRCAILFAHFASATMNL